MASQCRVLRGGQKGLHYAASCLKMQKDYELANRSPILTGNPVPKVKESSVESTFNMLNAMKNIVIRRLSLLLAVSMSFVTIADAAEYPWQKGQSIIGEEKVLIAKREYTFVDLGEEYNFGFNELIQANPEVDAWLPVAGDKIVLPGKFLLPDTPPEGIVINLPEYRLYYFSPEKKKVISYPIGIGTVDFPTPEMDTTVKMGLEKPTWYPPESVRKQRLKEYGEVLPASIPAGPDNPLGPFALLLDSNGYLIHGTNKGVGIGMRVSHGCIRLYNWDIEELVSITAKNTPVRIIKQPVKLAINGDQMWAEIHAEEGDSITQRKRYFINALTRLNIPASRYDLDAEAIERMIRQNTGIPSVVGVMIQKSPSLAAAQ
ncbi:L,D-transpeptidase family protein [Hahella ganghwensis]|uniref:L,D-transpeptidase family protein n=1 Tax=Hahella ganghwensis TaxID=286420 RepID=UPI0003A5A049|nr:L,D-transpeptidase family protein [Hahella ganghwensis]